MASRPPDRTRPLPRPCDTQRPPGGTTPGPGVDPHAPQGHRRGQPPGSGTRTRRRAAPPRHMVPAEGGPKVLKLKSSWHRRRRSKILAASLKHWKRRSRGGYPPSSCGVRPFYYIPAPPTPSPCTFNTDTPQQSISLCAPVGHRVPRSRAAAPHRIAPPIVCPAGPVPRPNAGGRAGAARSHGVPVLRQAPGPARSHARTRPRPRTRAQQLQITGIRSPDEDLHPPSMCSDVDMETDGATELRLAPTGGTFRRQNMLRTEAALAVSVDGGRWCRSGGGGGLWVSAECDSHCPAIARCA